MMGDRCSLSLSLSPASHNLITDPLLFFNQGQTLMYPFTFSFNQPTPIPFLLLKHLPYSQPRPHPFDPSPRNLKIYSSYRHPDSALMYCVYVTGHRPLPTADVHCPTTEGARHPPTLHTHPPHSLPGPPACQQLRTLPNLIKIFIYTAINKPGLSAM